MAAAPVAASQMAMLVVRTPDDPLQNADLVPGVAVHTATPPDALCSESATQEGPHGPALLAHAFAGIPTLGRCFQKSPPKLRSLPSQV